MSFVFQHTFQLCVPTAYCFILKHQINQSTDATDYTSTRVHNMLRDSGVLHYYVKEIQTPTDPTYQSKVNG